MKISDKFIKATDELCEFEKFVAAPYIRKSFTLDFVPDRAEITICGLGFYELYVNGENVTKGFLAPYISNPDDICYYDNYNITHNLKKGENVIGIVLGNGFRNSFGGFVWDFEKSESRGPLVTALCLEASGEGKKFELEADSSFKTHPSPIIFDELRMGCHYDARLEIPDWCKVGFDDSDWAFATEEKAPKGIPKLCEAEPIIACEEIAPVEIKHFDSLPFAYENTREDAKPFPQTVRKDVYVYDFGVNAAGVTKLKINGKKGQKITIRHAECLQNGKFSINTIIFNRPENGVLDKYLEYAQKDVFVCKGGEEVFIPKFKYDGFRYAYVEGLEPEQATKETLSYIVMNSALKPRAEFSCSDDTLNKLFEMTRRSDLANFYYFPTDCPHREKNGWTGDASVSAEQFLLNLECADSLREWLNNIRAAQTEKGILPGIVPTGGWGIEWGNGPAWDSVCVNLPYYIYKYDGRLDVAEENADMIVKYLKYIKTRRNEKGLIACGLGDWVAPFTDENGKPLSPLEFTDSAEIFDISRKAAYLFDKIGLKDYRDFANELAEQMRNAIRENLIDMKTMTVAGDCQTSQAVAIEMGIFDDVEIKAARDRLVEIIHRDDDVNTCGMIGLRYIYHALVNAGEAELAYKIITSKERSCYGAWIKRDATSLLENFPYENGVGLCSQNHHFLGDISSWLVQEIAGIKVNPKVQNVDEFEISPKFIGTVYSAQGKYRTKHGTIETSWKRKKDSVELSVNLPKKLICEVKIGQYAEKLSEEGRYLFTVNAATGETVKSK